VLAAIDYRKSNVSSAIGNFFTMHLIISEKPSLATDSIVVSEIATAVGQRGEKLDAAAHVGAGRAGEAAASFIIIATLGLWSKLRHRRDPYRPQARWHLSSRPPQKGNANAPFPRSSAISFAKAIRSDQKMSPKLTLDGVQGPQRSSRALVFRSFRFGRKPDAGSIAAAEKSPTGGMWKHGDTPG
jgi:hypothetical protein